MRTSTQNKINKKLIRIRNLSRLLDKIYGINIVSKDVQQKLYYATLTYKCSNKIVKLTNDIQSAL
ncbi:hypothetical protein ALC152_03820 [Arcobacter sp. 15-2]